MKLDVAKTSYPLDTQSIVDAQIDVEMYEDGLERLEKLKEEFDW